MKSHLIKSLRVPAVLLGLVAIAAQCKEVESFPSFGGIYVLDESSVVASGDSADGLEAATQLPREIIVYQHSLVRQGGNNQHRFSLIDKDHSGVWFKQRSVNNSAIQFDFGEDVSWLWSAENLWEDPHSADLGFGKGNACKWTFAASLTLNFEPSTRSLDAVYPWFRMDPTTGREIGPKENIWTNNPVVVAEWEKNPPPSFNLQFEASKNFAGEPETCDTLQASHYRILRARYDRASIQSIGDLRIAHPEADSEISTRINGLPSVRTQDFPIPANLKEMNLLFKSDR